VRIAFVRVSGDRLLTDQIGKVLGRYYGAAARKTLVLNRFPTALGDATLRLSPLVVAKMVLVIDSYRYPHTQITEVLLP